MSFKFNPFTGQLEPCIHSTINNSGNFSYKTIINGSSLTVPIYQEMIVTKYIIINGELILSGELTIII